MSVHRIALLSGAALIALRPNDRPREPGGMESVWYRGWECGYEPDRDRWTREGWTAYKGGCDLDAPQVTAPEWKQLLEAIDDEEDE